MRCCWYEDRVRFCGGPLLGSPTTITIAITIATTMMMVVVVIVVVGIHGIRIPSTNRRSSIRHSGGSSSSSSGHPCRSRRRWCWCRKTLS
jgi:hypothetical protein